VLLLLGRVAVPKQPSNQATKQVDNQTLPAGVKGGAISTCWTYSIANATEFHVSDFSSEKNSEGSFGETGGHQKKEQMCERKKEQMCDFL
jgi:hypothetical protein